MKVRFITLFLMFFMAFSMSSQERYSTKDVLAAYDAFNEHLFDKKRKLYYRDTDKPEKLGAIWTQAMYWDMAMNAYKLTGNKKYLKLVKDIFQGGAGEYDQYNWDNAVEWFIYDDIMWWTVSLARAYELTGDKKYLKLSETSFNRVWYGSPVVKDPGSYDPKRGGMYWQWIQTDPPNRPVNDGKMACINYPAVIGAMSLYNHTGNEEYFDKAKEIYQWAHDNLFNATTGAVADSKHGKGQPTWKMHVYNQATCIGAAVMLYKKTNDERYLNDAVLAADYVKNVMCDENGIIPGEGRGNLDNEQGIYTAILAQYIVRLIEDCNRPEYLPWLRHNIDTAWGNRDKKRNLVWKRYAIPTPEERPVTCYDASGIPALMLVCPPEK